MREGHRAIPVQTTSKSDTGLKSYRCFTVGRLNIPKMAGFHKKTEETREMTSNNAVEHPGPSRRVWGALQGRYKPSWGVRRQQRDPDTTSGMTILTPGMTILGPGMTIGASEGPQNTPERVLMPCKRGNGGLGWSERTVPDLRWVGNTGNPGQNRFL